MYKQHDLWHFARVVLVNRCRRPGQRYNIQDFKYLGDSLHPQDGVNKKKVAFLFSLDDIK